ncbi:MAG TPA: ABC transporter permease [Acidobacteriaceae bacterium]
MNMQTNAMPQSFDGPTAIPAVASRTRPLYWSVRREIWENRSVYIAPLATAAVFLIGFLISLIYLPARMRAISALDPAHQRAAIATHYDIAAGLMMLTAMLVGAFYSLGAFQSERRDRSILFWKSLPVSDLTAVLAKAIVPIVILQLLAFAITFVTQLVMLLLSSAVLWANGLSVTTLWTQLSFFRMSLLLLYHLVTVHALWYAPFYGYLLLVSAWARRAAFLWATLPLIAIGFVEKIAFHTSHLGSLLISRLGGGSEALVMPNTMPMNPTTHLTPVTYLASPGLWLGLLFTALCLAAAVWLRRYRGPN